MLSRANAEGSLVRGALSGIQRYGFAFAGEVAVCWGALVLFQIAAYPSFWHRLPLSLLTGLPVVAIGLLVAETSFRLYRRVWSVASLQDAQAIGLAAAEAILVIAAANALLSPSLRPFSMLVPLLSFPLAALVICAYRLMPRIRSAAPVAGNRILFVASDSTSYATIKSMLQKPGREWIPVGILITTGTDFRRTVMGTQVLGRADDLKHWIEVTQPDGVAFVLNGHAVDHRDKFATCLAAELPIFMLPSPEELFRNRNGGGSRLRELTADDLVGRSPREMDVALAAREVTDRTVLVTGAAGSIGSELCRILATLRPRRLVLLDTNESGIYELAEELRFTAASEISEALVSITDERLLLSAFQNEQPDVVFHAAAYKHVPMLERWPVQAVLTNVIGTRNTLRAAEAVGTKQFVFISTDKAVARHSVLGCSKRLGELMILAHGGGMKCWAVRFGNVVGSRGSVVPTFERQIRQGGPVTITHPEASRYMMTIREAVSLVVTTLHLASPHSLYALDMGQPIKILSLAQDLIRSRGLRPNKDIEVVFTGLRPGEVVTEQLLSAEEAWRPSDHPAIREIISPAITIGDVDTIVNGLHDAARRDLRDEVRSLLLQAMAVHSRPEFVTPADPGAESTSVPAWVYEE